MSDTHNTSDTHNMSDTLQLVVKVASTPVVKREIFSWRRNICLDVRTKHVLRAGFVCAEPAGSDLSPQVLISRAAWLSKNDKLTQNRQAEACRTICPTRFSLSSRLESRPFVITEYDLKEPQLSCLSLRASAARLVTPQCFRNR